MPRLPSVKPSECVRALEKLGFARVRQTGSHLRLSKGGRNVTVPMHKGKDLSAQTLRSILGQAGVSEDEFLNAL
ncbi:MAG TPA: type II toxin-antitoxin system HicA family toxin [Ktedonobacterales bacterium]|nr:type II toxin-antitoxin system HicA family toxin [Ktedonobacterales bacterium]